MINKIAAENAMYDVLCYYIYFFIEVYIFSTAPFPS